MVNQSLFLLLIIGLFHIANAKQFFIDYPIPNILTHGEETLCTVFEVSYEAVYLKSMDTFGDAKKYLHHAILFKTTDTEHEIGEVWSCGWEHAENSEYELANEHPATGWELVGGFGDTEDAKVDFGENIGLEIGTTSNFKYLHLQMHFKQATNSTDYSGLRLDVTDEQPETFGHVATCGMYNGSIPPHSTTNIEGSYEITSDIEGFPYGIFLHNHQIGVVISVWRVRNLSEWKLIRKDSPLDAPRWFDFGDSIENGDHIAIRCVYHSDRDEVTIMGSKRSDEMCIVYLGYFVLNDHSGLQVKVHVNKWAEMFSNVPEIEANTLNGTYYEPCTNC